MENESVRNDKNTTLDELKGIIAKFISERDWDGYHHPKEVAVSLSVEVGELLEIFQWMDKLPVEELKKNPELMERLRDELADVFGYTLDFADRLGIDITQAYLNKMQKNREKYPIHKSKGNHKKYTEL